MDIEALYPIGHWREVPDAVIEDGYAALGFLSAAGFRHFLPAFMRWVLLHQGSPAAVVDSTVWALAPDVYEGDLREYAVSKFELMTPQERDAIVRFLEAMLDDPDVDAPIGLAYWSQRSRT